MRWRVAISDFPNDPRLLRELLAPLAISLVAENDEHFLVGEPFELEQSAEAVHNIAIHLETVALEVKRGDSAARCSFKTGSVFERASGDSWRKHAFVTLQAGALAIATAVGVVTVGTSSALSEEERRRLEQERKELEFRDLSQRTIPRFVSAVRYPNALQVQQLLHGDLDPLTLGHIGEIIENDLGGAIKQLVSKRQWTRFQRSINHPDVFGVNARHIVSNEQPPPNPMSLSEAQAFIRELASKWLILKSS
jgi:hypothetical protein